MPLLDQVTEFMKHDLAKLLVLLVLMPFMIKITGMITPIIQSFLDERKRLLDETTKAREGLEKLAGNHIVHLEEAIRGMTTSNEKSNALLADRLKDVATVLDRVVTGMDHRDEKLSLELSNLRDTIRDQHNNH